MQDLHTIMDQRSLSWEGCENVRDLGGLPLRNGETTRFGKVIRSDFPGRLTLPGWQALIQMKVSTIIDLRAPKEVEAEPYTAPSGSGIRWLNLPMERFLPEVSAMIIQAQTRAEVYNIILDQYPDCVAQVLHTIASEQKGAVLIHCQAGKDRTGTVSALLLDLAGVPWHWIAADYAESQVRLHRLYEEAVRDAGSENNLSFWSRPTATAETMLTMLEHVSQSYGSTEGYLRFARMAENEIFRLKEILHRTA